MHIQNPAKKGFEFFCNKITVEYFLVGLDTLSSQYTGQTQPPVKTPKVQNLLPRWKIHSFNWRIENRKEEYPGGFVAK